MEKLQNNAKPIRLVFYFLYSASLLLQSWLMELNGDEAYYWRYSLEPAWGYFDHPPITSFLVNMGYSLFKNELGVRLFFVLLNVGTVWILERSTQPKDLRLFYAIICSVAFLHIGMALGGGAFAIPDFPLLFFSVLFFALYKKFLEAPSAWNVVALSLVTCLLLLSKYHGVLVIGLTVLSNLSLLKRKSFWAIVALSGLMLVPHVLWQVSNDFPSFKYHWLERSSRGYSISYTLEYLGSQPFILGPLVGLLLLGVGLRAKPSNTFERSLKFTAVGTYLFFLAMTFKGRVEGNWTVITLIPLFLLSYWRIELNEKLKKLVYYSFSLSLPLILLVKVALIWSILPFAIDLTKIFGAKKWSAELKAKSGGRPAAFMNSYQRAALYEFYAGVPSCSLNNIWGRKNQYTVWDTESRFQGKSTVVIANGPMANCDSIFFSGQYLPYTFIENFRTSSNIEIQHNLSSPVTIAPTDSLIIALGFGYKKNTSRDLEANREYPTQVIYSFFQNSNLIEMKVGNLVLKNDMVNPLREFNIKIQAPSIPGKYDFYLSAQTGWLPAGINAEKVTFVVRDGEPPATSTRQ